MRVLRSSLFVAATAIIAAACGDKVNVVGPNSGSTSTAAINSVQVAPSTATISVGQTVQLSAAVNATAGLSTTTTWSTGASAVATVSQSGLVAGVAAGTVGICATASASGVASVTNCASVLVSPASTVTPAVLQIASITVAGNLNAPVPVPPAAVAGQINVSVNLNPGTEKMDSVVVTVNGKSAATQLFTSGQAAALRAATGNGEDQALQSTLVFSINTAAYNGTTGAVTFVNGPATIAVVGYGHQGTSAVTNSSSQGVNLLFGNVDAWVVTQTLGSTKTANDPNGFAHQTGSVAVSAVPVLYSGLTIGTANANYGTAACDASGIGQRTLAMTAPAAGTFAWTASFPFTSAITATNNATNRATVNSYEFNGALAACVAATPGVNATGGEGPYVAAAQYTTTNSAPVGFALGSAVPVNRLDNRAPVNATPGFANPGGVAFAVGGRTNNWTNDALNIVGVSGTAGNAVFQSGGAAGQLQDQGVGLATTGAVVATVTGGNLTAATSLTNTTTLTESATNATYTAVYTFVDNLGNTSVPSAAGTQQIKFGVDRTAPVLNYIPGPANNTGYGTIGSVPPYAFSATDATVTPGAAPSGFFNLAATPLTMSEQARNSLTTTFWCPATASFVTTAVGCATWPAAGGTTFPANLNQPTNVGAATGGNNYYSAVATVADQAGNVSAQATNVFALDQVAPVIGGVNFPPFLAAGGANTFTSAISTTGLDIALSRMNLQYGTIAVPSLGLWDASGSALGAAFVPTSAAGGATLWNPDAVVDAFNPTTILTAAPFSVTVNPLSVNVQGATSAAGTNPAAAGKPLAAVNAFALNQATIPAVGISAPSQGVVGAASMPAPTGISNTGLAGAGPVNFEICAIGNGLAAACASPPTAPAGAGATVTISRTGTVAVPATTVSITAVAEGSTGVFNNPFSSVQFWAYDPTAGATEGWRLIGTVVNSSTVTDGGAAVPSGRNWQFSTVWTPNLTNAPDNAVYKVVAFGIGGTSLPAAQQGQTLATPIGYTTVTIVP